MAFTDDIALYAFGRVLHESRPTRVDPLCLNTFQWKSTCTECTDACPAGVDAHENNIDWSACTGCNLCVSACPTSALNESRTSFDEILTALASEKGEVVCACERYDGACDVRRKCLCALPWDLLAAITESKKLVLKLQPCRDCPDARLVERTKEEIKKARSFLGKAEFEKRVSQTSTTAALEEQAIRKRQAFSRIAHTARSEVEELVSGTGDLTTSRYRALLLEALEMGDESRVYRWKSLEEDGDCRACGACTTMCPHNALELDLHEDGDSCLRYDARLCTQCGMCYMSCPEMTLGGWRRTQRSFKDAVISFPLDVSFCEKCGRPFKPAGDEAKCPSCSRFRFA